MVAYCLFTLWIQTPARLNWEIYIIRSVVFCWWIQDWRSNDAKASQLTTIVFVTMHHHHCSIVYKRNEYNDHCSSNLLILSIRMSRVCFAGTYRKNTRWRWKDNLLNVTTTLWNFMKWSLTQQYIVNSMIWPLLVQNCLLHHHRQTAVHCWIYASPTTPHLVRSSAFRTQFLPAVSNYENKKNHSFRKAKQ